MSMPNFKDIRADHFCRKDVINLLLVSIAAEELGLAHIINAEAEKIQFVIGTLHGGKICPDLTVKDLLLIDKSVDKVLQTVIKKEIILQFKLEEVIELIGKEKICYPTECDIDECDMDECDMDECEK
jgi:hypothetical protein